WPKTVAGRVSQANSRTANCRNRGIGGKPREAGRTSEDVAAEPAFSRGRGEVTRAAEPLQPREGWSSSCYPPYPQSSPLSPSSKTLRPNYPRDASKMEILSS